jgi:hypothetical protein
MFAIAPFILDSLMAQPSVDNQEPQPRLGPPSPNGDNGESTNDSPLGPPSPNGDNGESSRESRLGSPIGTGDNGNAQMTENERRLRLGPPLRTGDNGNAQMTENERLLRLRPPLLDPHATVITVNRQVNRAAVSANGNLADIVRLHDLDGNRSLYRLHS